MWVLLGLAPAALAAFLRVEARAAVPLVDLGLLRRNRLFAAANLAALLNYCALYAISVLTAMQLQLVLGHPARVAGWIMLGQPLMQALLSPLSRAAQRPHRLPDPGHGGHGDRGRRAWSCWP